jgi:hypothetical protein
MAKLGFLSSRFGWWYWEQSRNGTYSSRMECGPWWITSLVCCSRFSRHREQSSVGDALPLVTCLVRGSSACVSDAPGHASVIWWRICSCCLISPPLARSLGPKARLPEACWRYEGGDHAIYALHHPQFWSWPCWIRMVMRGLKNEQSCFVICTLFLSC